MWIPKRAIRVLFWIVAFLLITVTAWFGQRQYVAYQEYRQQVAIEELERTFMKRVEERQHEITLPSTLLRRWYQDPVLIPSR